MSSTENFSDRHIGLDPTALSTMLGVIGVESLDELAAKALPAGILDALTADGVAPGLQTLPAPATVALTRLAAGQTARLVVSTDFR